MNPAQHLHQLGQSLWLDSINRVMLRTGTLASYIDELAVTGPGALDAPDRSDAPRGAPRVRANRQGRSEPGREHRSEPTHRVLVGSWQLLAASGHLLLAADNLVAAERGTSCSLGVPGNEPARETFQLLTTIRRLSQCLEAPLSRRTVAVSA
jgi:hypothetical protein